MLGVLLRLVAPATPQQETATTLRQTRHSTAIMPAAMDGAIRAMALKGHSLPVSSVI